MTGKLAPPWTPRNRKIADRNARLHRLRRNGILKLMTKNEMRALIALTTPKPAR